MKMLPFARSARAILPGLGILSALILTLSATATAQADPSTPTCTDPHITCGLTVLDNTGVNGLYGVGARAIDAAIAANPRPNLTPIPTDPKELYSRAYRQVKVSTDIFDSPNGKTVGHLDPGFNFVNAGSVENGWVQIRAGQWLPDSTLGPINKAVSSFSGLELPNGLPKTQFAWVLLDTRPSATPGAQPVKGLAYIKRYTLVNLFASTVVDGWTWYLIGQDQWIIQTRIAIPHPVQRPQGVTGKWVAVDLYEQTAIAYQDDTPVFVTLISSGLGKWPTTEGLTQIYERHTDIKMSGDSGNPDFYYLPDVPYVMYFNVQQEALHGAYWHDGFGFRHSHGCINLSITDAKWIFQWTLDQPDAWVYVYHSGVYGQGYTR